MSEVDPLLLAMTSSGLIDEENKKDGEKMLGDKDSEDKRSSSSPGPCDDSKESEMSSPPPLLKQSSSAPTVRTVPGGFHPFAGKIEDDDTSSEFRTVRLKRPNATAIEGFFDKKRKLNNSDDYKSPDSFSLNCGVLKEIFEGNFSENEPIMVQVSYICDEIIFYLFYLSFLLDDHEAKDKGEKASSLSLRWKVLDG